MEIKGDHNERLETNHSRKIRKRKNILAQQYCIPQSENMVFKSWVIFSVF
jgi:hypothetical protein